VSAAAGRECARWAPARPLRAVTAPVPIPVPAARPSPRRRCRYCSAMMEQRRAMLSSLLQPDARERLSRVAIVRPDNARAVEDHIIAAARSGTLREPVSEGLLIKMLDQVSGGGGGGSAPGGGAASGGVKKVVIQRKKRSDSDDDDDL
jgi:programmed cell death protein 5